MQIYLFLAEGFEEIEAIAPIDIFRRANIQVTTISITDKKSVTGAHGITVMADNIFTEQKFEDNCFLFLPGGLPGTTNLDNHEGLKSLIQAQAKRGNKMAAICAAPSILGKLGILQNEEAICYPGFENQLLQATLSNNDIVSSNNIFTAKAAGAALEFALMIVTDLKGKATADAIRSGMFIK
jgi:4-methyl-5(b-hydroxyethyl)-thiazole monophosphate biosynthesis